MLEVKLKGITEKNRIKSRRRSKILRLWQLKEVEKLDRSGRIMIRFLKEPSGELTYIWRQNWQELETLERRRMGSRVEELRWRIWAVRLALKMRDMFSLWHLGKIQGEHRLLNALKSVTFKISCHIRKQLKGAWEEEIRA
jgi:hypothetical protein